MKTCVWTAGVLFLAANYGLAADTKGDPRAAALLKEAAKTRYTWSPDVSGVSGRFTWEQDGKTGAGTFHVQFHKGRAGRNLTAEGNEPLPADVKDHVLSMIMHRTPAAPGAKERPEPDAVIVVEDDERGPLILTMGDPMQSTERVKDGKLVQVNRVMGGKRFTIDVTEFEKTADGERVYPSAFTVTWWDAATGKRTERQHYTTQGFSAIDGQMFPKAEKVVSDKEGKTSTLVLQYSDVKFGMGETPAGGKSQK
jgi:hypothetical protein